MIMGIDNGRPLFALLLYEICKIWNVATCTAKTLRTLTE